MNKNEETRDKILRVSAELFMNKGYDKTTLTDIINNLDGLTKGAIYYHFDSKEEIFNEVVSNLGNKNIDPLNDIKFAEGLTGKEKLIKIVNLSFSNDVMSSITSLSPSLLDQPHMLLTFFQELINFSIPEYYFPVIQEGIADGSIKADDPCELAGFIGLMLNVYLNPMIFEDKNEITRQNKKRIINEALSTFDITLFDLE